MTDISLENYFYNSQLKRSFVQFMAIFSGLKVSIGKNKFDSATNLIEVPIVYGSRDRVVSYIFQEQTQNKMLRLPTMSAAMTSIRLSRDRLAGQNQIRKEVKVRRGGTIPDDLVQHSMLKPVPYEVTMELSINTSNTDSQLQMLEQIMLLFNPSLQIQLSDVFGDQTAIMEVEMQDVNLDENYPAGNDERIISSALTFTYIMNLSGPVDLRDEIIKEIKVRFGNIDEFGINVNSGDIDPFVISANNWKTT